MERQSSASLDRTSSAISLLMDDLVKHWARTYGPQNENSRQIFETKMHRYSMSIVGSRITPLCDCDEPSVVALVRKQLSETGKESSFPRFESLVRRLSRSGVLQKPYHTLYLLHSIGAFAGKDKNMPPSMSVFSSAPTTSISMPQPQAGAVVPHSTPPPPAVVISQQGTSMTTNETVLRDIVFSLQGVDTNTIQYNRTKNSLEISPNIPHPYHSLIWGVCELGWLYRQIVHFISVTSENSSCGLVAQSLASALRDEMVDFYRLVAVLESQANPNTPADKRLTLRRLNVWGYDPTHKMKLIAMLADAAKGLKGGQLASNINKHKHHGDPIVQTLVSRIMGKVCVPLFEMVRKWIFDGVLEDPFDEFFIAKQQVGDESTWHNKYVLRPTMLPDFLSQETARNILNTGKAVNFIRVVCNDVEWVLENIADLSQQKMEYGKENNVTSVVNEVAQKTQKHLLNLLFKKHKLDIHVRGIKRYLLLGQGDFATHLMDMLSSELSKPSQQIYNHNLSAILESAVRASNAQFDDPAVLNCLDAVVLTRTVGEEGWDVFSLSYGVQSPITVLLTPTILTAYRKMFNFIWRLKRVSRNLAAAWHDDMMVSRWQRSLLAECPSTRPFFVHLGKCHMLRSDMNYVVKQLEYYFMFEVLECSWQKVDKEMKEAKDFDQVLDAHNQYIQHLTSRILLSAEAHKQKSELAALTLLQLLDNMLRFRKLQLALVNAQKRAAELLRSHHKYLSRDPTSKGKLTEIKNVLTVPEEWVSQFVEVQMAHSHLLAKLLSALKLFPDVSLRSLLSSA